MDDATQEKIYLANLAAVVGNYIDAGVERFLMAGAVRDQAALAALRGAVQVPLRVIRLTLPLSEIEARLGPAVTVGRQDDLHTAADWIKASTGVGLEDVTVSNDRPIRETALEIIKWLDWQLPFEQ